MNFEVWFSSNSSNISIRSAEAVLRLTAEGATIPFIARYRKEQTGGLDELQIQKVIDLHDNWEQILHRQKFILGEIEKQQKLTPELKERISNTFDLTFLDDLYLPYKQKRKTKATQAKEAGLQELADWIWNCGHGTETPQPGQTLEIWAFTFRNDLKGITNAEAALNGALDILIERISETQTLRQLVRQRIFETGSVITTKSDKAKPHSKYENYFSYKEEIKSLLEPQNSHRYMALRRGWLEEELALSIGGEFEEELLNTFTAEAVSVPDSVGDEILKKAARLALKAHVQPSIENEVHKALKQVADQMAISVFSENVRKLLMASPFGPKAVLGVDPGIRTGCKLAVVDSAGKYIASTVIHLQTDEAKKNSAILLPEIVKTGLIEAIAVGNGTAGRETETFIRDSLKAAGVVTVPVVLVNESGASVYSASEAARDEFPDLDLTVRGAISIARRLQDPLAELVKIDPKSIGVGQYQHDVSESALKRSLDLVVDSCVNQVGVNLNTASYHLLSHVSGIGPALAKGIVEFRTTKGLFNSRDQLLEVPRFSNKAFEQAAGFLRIPEASNPLDNTGVHPESYKLIEQFATRHNLKIQDLLGKNAHLLEKDDHFKNEVGEFTSKDIVAELEKPGRDPRETFVPFQFREDIHEVKDLTPGMMCPGIVTNVTNFGAFVDIGVHQDGLVHLSQLSNRFVKDPKEVVSPGDRVTVKVLEVNLDKSQISLSMKAAAVVEKPKLTMPRPGPKPTPRANHSNKIQPAASVQKRAPKPRQVFNNAFAGLASMKNQLKSQK